MKVQVPIAQALGADAVSAELADLATVTLRQHHYRPVTASGQALSASTILLPARSRPRWREEWLAEMERLPTRRRRAAFAAQMMLAIGRMAVDLRPALAIRTWSRRMTILLLAAASGLITATWASTAAALIPVVAVFATTIWVAMSEERTQRIIRLIEALRENAKH